MKWDHLYEGLNPKYWHMLAHKVDGKHPTSYSNLPLATWRLERWKAARDPLLLKATTIRGLNVAQSQKSGYLFTSRKLKGNHTFTALSTKVENTETEEDSSVKQEGEEEAESSVEEHAETSRGVRGTAQSVGYIIHFANVVELYQRKNQNCFRFGSPDHLMRDCPKDLSKTTQKVSLNAKEGIAKEGSWTPQKPVVAQPTSSDEAPKAWRHLNKFPLELQST